MGSPETFHRDEPTSLPPSDAEKPKSGKDLTMPRTEQGATQHEAEDERLFQQAVVGELRRLPLAKQVESSLQHRELLRESLAMIEAEHDRIPLPSTSEAERERAALLVFTWGFISDALKMQDEINRVIAGSRISDLDGANVQAHPFDEIITFGENSMYRDQEGGRKSAGKFLTEAFGGRSAVTFDDFLDLHPESDSGSQPEEESDLMQYLRVHREFQDTIIGIDARIRACRKAMHGGASMMESGQLAKSENALLQIRERLTIAFDYAKTIEEKEAKLNSFSQEIIRAKHIDYEAIQACLKAVETGCNLASRLSGIGESVSGEIVSRLGTPAAGIAHTLCMGGYYVLTGARDVRSAAANVVCGTISAVCPIPCVRGAIIRKLSSIPATKVLVESTTVIAENFLRQCLKRGLTGRIVSEFAGILFKEITEKIPMDLLWCTISGKTYDPTQSVKRQEKRVAKASVKYVGDKVLQRFKIKK